jgi:DNA-binding transcriptional MerR regulator
MSEADDGLGIGEFSRLSRLSPKALGLYERMGLLEPQWVDPATGHRRYGRGQVERARLVASLRQVGIPLADIRQALRQGGRPGAEQIAEFWAEAEAEHAARRRLVNNLIDRLQGKAPGMSTAYPVRVRELPARMVLSVTRHVTNEELTDVGKEFVTGFRAAGVDALPGMEGAPFTIYYGEVSEDSDGPIEWCWPVPEAQAEDLAERFPELTLRADHAHLEAYVHYGRASQLHVSRIALAVESMLSWARDRDKRVTGGLRLLYRAGSAGDGPDLDLSLPVR